MKYVLPEYPRISAANAAKVLSDYERFGREGLPADFEGYIKEAYGLDIGGRYAGYATRNPFGKASGQLSLARRQVEVDAEAGLGFVALKTVIAQDETGEQMMKEWAFKETRMHLEPIAGKQVGELGWTITWKGRGWHESFDAYLTFFRESLAIADRTGMVIAPSVKYHLPGPGETQWKASEYSYTTQQLLNVWREAGRTGPMPLEKDFSPTLSGDSRSSQQARILEWMETCPRLIREAAEPGSLTLGIKLMNAVFDDSFQMEMIKTQVEQGSPDFIIYANRLFDPEKEFEGKVGVAYGGPDLSGRNLRLLTWLRRAEREGLLSAPVPPISGTGDVCSGKIALEYALRGCESLQMHTYFQLPEVYYGMKAKNSKTHRALYALIFHPLTGLLPWMLHLKEQYGLDSFLGAASFYRTAEGAGLLEKGAE